ncbi:MAG TPA: UTP--glucose-1-phosphate uridylyltransferase [Candidatus Pacearchaeota archaeon]|mgnify:CR=1 FL=1|nr:UTP--glucose-1-phosphate uridylyltransferase [Candidatus Pacearchaeota archaeon]HPR79609.1 UTP--glucose-1-phosphate uridylyltransferase [Candidatus Pacearchaeota archaeon]
MKKTVKKAIFPIAGMGTRFLPLSKVVSKELIPLVDKPLIHYSVEEALLSGIKEIQLVTRKSQKDVTAYFNSNPELEALLRERNKKEELEMVKGLNEVSKQIKFSFSIQKKASGNVDAIYQARNFAGNEPVGVFFCDDIIYSKELPGFQQLKEIYETCQRPVIGLKRMPRDKLSQYGVVEVEKIANNVFKIKKVVEKPKGEPPSDLVILGRYIITPEVFERIENDKSMRMNDYSISQVLGQMAEEGKVIYGYEIKGDWLECGDKNTWFKSFLTLLLDHPDFGQKAKEFLKGKI